MESLRVLLLTIGLAVIIAVVTSALFHAYESKIPSLALSTIHEVYSAISSVGTSIIHTEYPICVTNSSKIVQIVLPRSVIRLVVPKIAIGSTCCVGTCMIVTSRRTFRLGMGNLSISSILTYVPPSNRTRIIIHGGKLREECRYVHHCRLSLDIRLVSHGSCGVDYTFHVITQAICVNKNCTYSISISYPPNLAKYIGIFKHTNKSIVIGLEDCSCCDFDKRDEILSITILRNIIHIVILQSKGGFSHELYINGREVYYKPAGLYRTYIDLGEYPMMCILKKHCYKICR